MTFAVVPARWQTHRAALERIRREVFIDEQGVPEAEEWDQYDADASHWLALDIPTAEPLATVRLLAEGKVTRMAVRKDWRRQGIGATLLAAVVGEARNQGLISLYLDAQMAAAEFYQKLGFIAVGELFMDVGILHIRMHKKLTEAS